MEEIKMTHEEMEEARQAVKAWEKVKANGDKIRLTLTAEELEMLETALNRYNVDMAKEATKREAGKSYAEIIEAPNIWREEWRNGGRLYSKLYAHEEKALKKYL